MRDITLRDSAIYSNRLPTVPFAFEKLVRRIKYLISWQRHYLNRPFWNCLTHWSTIFLIYIPKGRTNTKWWSTPRPQAPCYHYDCGGELEIIISHVDVQWKDSPVCYRLGGKLATHIGDVSFGGTDVSFLTLNHNLNATTMSLLLYSYYGTSRLPTRWRQNVTYYHQSFADGRYIPYVTMIGHWAQKLNDKVWHNTQEISPNDPVA